MERQLEIKLRVVVFREGNVWVAQGVDYDIAAHGKDMGALMRTFERMLVENMAITTHLGRQPLEGVKPAPERFRLMYESAEAKVAPTRERPLSSAGLSYRMAA
jgi:hypothetical protein